MQKQKLYKLLFLAIILLALIVRIVNIDNVPSGIYPDEANNGTNAFNAQLTNDYKWFYPDNNGREGLYINAMALFFKLFGVSFLTIKLTSIIMGTLTVCGVYLLSRELFISKPRLALIASYLTAVSFWAVNFSRIAFRAIMMLPILTFSFYFLFRGLRTKKWYDFALAGFIFGLGFHTYIAFRVAPALLIVLFVLLLIQRGKVIITKYWKHWLIFIVFAFISTLPMLLTFHTHPEFLNARTGDVSVMANSDEHLVQTLSQTFTKSILKFNVSGDQNWRHGYPPYPTLEFFVGIMFALGFFLSIWIFVSYTYKRFFQKIKNRKLVTHGFLLAWFFAFLAPEFLTVEGLPHSLRSIGVLPVVYIFSAFFINYLLERIEKYSHAKYSLLYILIFTALFVSGAVNIIKYHVFWAEEQKQAESFNQDLTDIARYLQTLPKDKTVYVIADNMQRLPIKLLNENRDIIFISSDDTDKISFDDDFIILSPTQQDDFLLKLSSHGAVTSETIPTKHNQTFTIITPLKN